MRDSPDLSRKFYKNLNLRVCDVRLTKLIDFENIALRFEANIKLYKPIAHSVWKLVFGRVQSRRSVPNVTTGLCQGHCFSIKNLDILTNHWECAVCQQRFSYHDNYNRHMNEKR